MKLHLSSRSLLIVAASAALTLATPCAVRAQQPTPAASNPDSDVFDIIKKGADKLQKQAKETKELGPKVKLLEDRQNDLHKKMTEMEQKLAKQQETIDLLRKELEKQTAPKPTAPADPAKPLGPLPVTEPATQPTPAAAPSPSAP